MNHLRELLETPIGAHTGAPQVTEVHHQRADELLQILGRSAVCFWLGETEVIPHCGDRPLPSAIFGLPFECCWFEFSSWKAVGPRATYCIGTVQTTAGTYVMCWRRHAKCDWNLLGCELVDWMKFVQAEGIDGFGDTADDLRVHASVVIDFLVAINCQNVFRSEHTPDAKLQRARAKRGKQPLFSFWTLQLKGRHAGEMGHGGTHAAPRVHLRRGHPREFKPGEWTWVQPHMVGNKADGMVHKDYAAKFNKPFGSDDGNVH